MRGKIKAGKSVFKTTAKIESSDLTFGPESTVTIGTAHDSKIELHYGGALTAKKTVINTEFTLGPKTTSEFDSNLTGVTISASDSISLKTATVKAQNSTFSGILPSSPLLTSESLREKVKVFDDKYYLKIIGEMPSFFGAALGLGQAGEVINARQFSKMAWRPRLFSLCDNSAEFVSDLFEVMAAGLPLEGSPLKLAKGFGKKRCNDITDVIKHIDRMEKSPCLLIYPLFKSKQDARAFDDASKIKGPFHYRIILTTDDDAYDILASGYELFDNEERPDVNGYPVGYIKKPINEIYTYVDIEYTPTENPAASLRTTNSNAVNEIVAKINESAWLKAPDTLFLDASFKATNDFRVENGNICLPYYASNYSSVSDMRENQRPRYKDVKRRLIELCDKIGSDYLVLPTIKSVVLENCTLKNVRTDFNTDDFTGITLSGFKGKMYALGSLDKSTYTDKSDLSLHALGDVDLHFARITNSSKVIIESWHPQGAPLTVSANAMEISDSMLIAKLTTQDKISFDGSKISKAFIQIKNGQDVSFENAEITDCTIEIHNSARVAFNKASLISCKVKIEGDKVYFAESTITGDGSVIELKAKSVEFKGAAIIGPTTIKGEVETAGFESTKLGDDARTSDKLSHFQLASKNSTFTNAEFGNINFSNDAKVNAKGTDWGTVKVVGNVVASGPTAKVLYPLFGTASNLEAETPPVISAGNKAHPARKYGLDCQ